MTVSDIYNKLDKIAPFSSQEEWDNAGILVGNSKAEVKKILIALDASSSVIDEAISNRFNLIVTHHPVIFHPLKSVVEDDVTGENIIKLVKNDISVISAHTNADKYIVNDLLIEKLGAVKEAKYNDFLTIGTVINEKTLPEYISFIKTALGNYGIRYYNSGKKVHHVGCCGGSGGEFIYDAYKLGCDTYVTADIKHNIWLDAKQLGINLIDADHFNTENCVVRAFYELLTKEFPDVEISIANNNKQVICYG